MTMTRTIRILGHLALATGCAGIAAAAAIQYLGWQPGFHADHAIHAALAALAAGALALATLRRATIATQTADAQRMSLLLAHMNDTTRAANHGTHRNRLA